MEIKIESVQNGFIVYVEGSLRKKGRFIYKNTEELKMLEEIGEIILDKKVKVTPR